jgi:serine/threonine-protein kinase
MTRDGDMMGTLAYMSPEQMLGRAVDFRTDIFAVGAVAYELLAYQRAFRKPDPTDSTPYQRHPDDEPQPIAELCPGLPPALELIVARALAKRPEDRFGDLEEARAALREVRRGIEPDLTLQPTPGRRPAEGRPPSSSGSPRERTARERITEAESKFSRGDIGGAATLVQQVLELDPRNETALGLAARLQAAAASATIVLSRSLPRDAPVEQRGSDLGPIADAVTTPLPTPHRRTGTVAVAAAVLIAMVALGAWLFMRREPVATQQAVVTQSPRVTEAQPSTTAGAPPPAPIERPPSAKPIDTPAAPSDPSVAKSNDARVRSTARQIAQDALDGMAAAERAARAQNAPELSRATFDQASRSKRLAEQAMARDDYTEVGAQALRAIQNYRLAASEAIATAAATQTAIQTAPSPAVTNPPVGTSPAPTNPSTSSAASPPVTPAKNEPPPVTPTTPTLLDRERPGILATLNRYQAAYRERSVKALAAVYPSIPRETRQALDRAFTRDCRDYDVTFGNMLLALNADDPTYATVTVRSTYTCQPKGAQAAQPQSIQELFVLRKLGDGWLIDSAGVMDTNRRQ